MYSIVTEMREHQMLNITGIVNLSPTCVYTKVTRHGEFIIYIGLYSNSVWYFPISIVPYFHLHQSSATRASRYKRIGIYLQKVQQSQVQMFASYKFSYLYPPNWPGDEIPHGQHHGWEWLKLLPRRRWWANSVSFCTTHSHQAT